MREHPDALFQRGQFLVTRNFLRTKTRTYDLSRIEAYRLSRPLFVMALFLCGLVMAFTLRFVDLLYADEIFMILGVCAVIILITSQVATLSIISVSLRGNEMAEAVTWHVGTLQKMADALAHAMELRRERMPDAHSWENVNDDPL